MNIHVVGLPFSDSRFVCSCLTKRFVCSSSTRLSIDRESVSASLTTMPSSDDALFTAAGAERRFVTNEVKGSNAGSEDECEGRFLLEVATTSKSCNNGQKRESLEIRQILKDNSS